MPLIFQYLAGFEEYFFYAWEKIKTNLKSDYYLSNAKEVVESAEKSIESIYHPSRTMSGFLHQIPNEQKTQLEKTAKELEFLNAQLLILTIGLREGVKGVVIGQQMLPRVAEEYEETIFDQFINEKIMHKNIREHQELVGASKMLAPLFGNQSLIISHYPDFYSHIAQEMEELVKSEKYLHERVKMEHKVLQIATNLPYPLGCSYAEIAMFAGKKPYFSELLYVLAETFPTTSPRLIFTSSLMNDVLTKKNSAIVEA